MKIIKVGNKIPTVDGKVIKVVSGGGVEDVEWHQCPQLVRDYLDNVTYNPNDYTTSQIANYAPSTAVTSNTKPIGKTVDSVTYYNEVPNVKTPFASTNKAGTVKPLDGLRWIYTPNIINIRDLGGWTCDGGTIKYGKIFRGREFSGGNYPIATQADISIARESMHITSEIDLRGDSECDGIDGTIGTADDIVSSAFGADVKYGRWAISSYATSLNQTALMKSLLNTIMTDICTSNVLYIHCMAGADRTGTVCALLEAVLGVSQSDIDKDFELTSFTGEFRKRTDTGYIAMINTINSYTGNSLRDKVVNWMQSIGITIDTINAFRAVMIDGTPEVLTSQVDEFSVTNTLNRVTTDNNSEIATQYQPYEAILAPHNGYVIDSITVTMGGVDITPVVVAGDKTTFNQSITNTLTNCRAANAKSWAINGQGYVEDIEVDGGCQFDENSVHVYMNGADITSAVVTFFGSEPQVIINIVDTIGYAEDTRLSTSEGSNRTGATGIVSFGSNDTTDKMIPISAGDVIRIKGVTFPSESDNKCSFVTYKSDGTFNFATYLYQSHTHISNRFDITYNGDLTIMTVPNSHDVNDAYMRICGLCNNPANVIITINQEIS